MTNEEIKELVENHTYDGAKAAIKDMNQWDLKALYYWGYRLNKPIFCSAASQILSNVYGTTPWYDLCGERMSQFV
jgi:hypothetical protein